MRAYGYLRVSTKRQAQSDKFGLAEQKAAIEEWAESNGYELDGFFVDDGYSGTTQNRPELQKLLSIIKNKESLPIIVAKMDRWARDTFLHLFLEKEVVKHGSKILSVSEDGFNDTDNPTNELMREIMMAFAKFEAQRITSRMSGGRKQKAKSGKHATGRVPFGYKKDAEGNLVVNHEEAIIVNQIFSYRESGKSLRAIAGILNEQGHTTKSGSIWRAKSVSYILKNKKYKGILEQSVQGEQVTARNESITIYGK